VLPVDKQRLAKQGKQWEGADQRRLESVVSLQTTRVQGIEHALASVRQLLTDKIEDVTLSSKQQIARLFETICLLTDAGDNTEQSLSDNKELILSISKEFDSFRSEVTDLRAEINTMATHQKELVEIVDKSNATLADKLQLFQYLWPKINL
jgi:chromosome segregation ATPase